MKSGTDQTSRPNLVNSVAARLNCPGLPSKRLAALALACALATSCSESSQTPVAQTPGEPSAAGKLLLEARVDHLDTVAREPMVAVHPDGTIFVSGYGSQVTGTDWTVPPPLWRSEDAGQSWTKVYVGTAEDGAQGNSDVDLTIGPNGTVYLFAMGFNRKTRQGTHMAMGVSVDKGNSWNWHRLSETRLDDRPWVSIAPDGTAHAIWNDGSGVAYAKSSDAGVSWTEQPRIHPIGGSSHLAVGPNGELAVRISPISASGNQFDVEADSISVSTDAGVTWQNHPVPGNVEWDPTFTDPTKIPRWVEPLAWGPGPTLYHLWSEVDSVYLGWSKDFGVTWQRQEIFNGPGVSFFPYMVSNAAGRLAATWFVQEGESLSARLAVMPHTDDSTEVFIADAFTPLAWLEDTENKVPNPAGEYIPVAFLANGDVAVVSPIQDIHEGRWGFTFWRFRLN